MGVDFDRRAVIWNVATYLAGGVSETLWGRHYSPGMSNDIKQAQKIISTYLKTSVSENWHEASIRSQNTQKDKSSLELELTEAQKKQAKQIYKEAEELAYFILKKNEKLVFEVSSQLLKQGYIEGKEFYELKDKYGVELDYKRGSFFLPSSLGVKLKSFFEFFKSPQNLRYSLKYRISEKEDPLAFEIKAPNEDRRNIERKGSSCRGLF